MPATELLYSRSDDAALKLKAIQRARNAAYADILERVSLLRQETGASEKDVEYMMNYVHDGLEGMLTDVIAAHEDERGEADDAISNIEERDLRLSGSVW